MRTHTSDFKNTIKQFGRELDSKITYGATELGKEQLNSVTPHYESSLLKSVMKQLDIDSNVEIPLETVINYQFGVKVGNSYEYLNYGNYVVYKVEKQEDTRSWKITCYDKMLYAMKDYESLGITYPITVKNFLSAICTKLGLTLASDDFVNANKEITSELYLDGEGNSLGYTYRDVLDELSQVVAGIICINNDDEVEVRYPSNAGEYETVEGTFLHLNNVDDIDDFSYELKGNTVQDGTPSPDSPVDIETVTGTQEINIANKNLYKPYNYSRTHNQVLFTHNEDGTITAVGTASSNCFSILNSTVASNDWYITLGAGTYTLSGGISSSIRLDVIDSDGTTLAIDRGANATFTITEKKKVYIRAYVTSGTVANATLYPQLEVGSTATEYEEYNGQSYEIKLDNNLFDGKMEQGTFNSAGGKVGSNYRVRSTNFTTIENENTYRFSLKNSEDYNIVLYVYNMNETFIQSESMTSWVDLPYEKTIASNRKVKFALKYKSGNTVPIYPNDVKGIKIENSPYNQTPIELCKIGDYKDKIYKQDGKWYLHKEIGKIILNGSETNWNINGTGTSNYFYNRGFAPLMKTGGLSALSTHYPYTTVYTSNTNQGFYISATDSSSQVRIRYGAEQSLADFKTWLSNNNVSIYYVLETPTTTEITDTELLGQLEAIRLQLGINNISVSSDYLSSPLKLTYLSELETIDEEMLKDVNVNFGEVFGEVNSVVLSRSAESDNIYRKDDDSIEENGLTEIKIKDNQILNGNNRDEFIDGIFDKLKGLKYYVNDYVSTGIGYLELGDFYKVQVENNSYKCLMLNDELDVTQGLEEPIHAEGMEDSETDYTKADKTDRKINQAYIIVDKQNQEINYVVQNVSTLQTLVNSQGEQIDSLGTRITQNIDGITASVSSIQSELDNGVGLVKTTSVIINDEGLTVATDTSKTTTTMTSDKFVVRSGGKDLAYFGYDDDLGSTKAEMDNLTVSKYFVAGYHRTEKYDVNLEHRTGVFYIGE